MTQIIEVPFVAGQNEGVDSKLLDPAAGLRLLQNGRITRDGRIEVRPQFSALSMTAWGLGSDVVAYDLATFEDRLLAFGALASSTQPYPTQIFSYIGQSQGAWKGLFDSASLQYAAFPFVSDLEAVWHAPTGNTMTNSDVAYTNGYVCVISTEPNTAVSKVWVLRGDVVLATLSISACVSSRVVACGNTFVLLSRMTDGDVLARTFATGSSTAFSGVTGLISNLATGTFTWDVTPVVGTTDFIIAYPEPAGTDIEVERYTAALSQVWAQTINVTPGNMAVVANSTHTLLCYVDASSNAQLYTRNSTNGAAIAGPTNIMGPGAGSANCVGTPALAITASDRVLVECSANTGTTVRSLNAVYSITAHTGISTGQHDDVFIGSKLYTQQRDSSTLMGGGIGSCTIFGNALGTDMLFANTIQSVQDGFILAARWNYGYADRLNDSRVTNYHGRSSIAADGAGTFWGIAGVLDEGDILTTGAGSLQLVRFKSGATARRQSAEMQGALYVAGGFVGFFDGHTLGEAGGFLDTPVIFANAQAAAGSLTQLATYTYVAVYEWRDAKGRLHRSAPSKPFQVVMTGANDENTLTVSTAHSLRRADAKSGGSVVETVVYRNTPNDSVFYRVGAGSAASGTTTYANPITVNDRMSDSTAQEQAVLYTQSQQPVEHVAFLPARFIAAGRDRLILGGLPDPYMVAFSKLPFPGEPMNGADAEGEIAYQVRLPEKVTAVSGFGNSYVAFTESGIYEIPGGGPQRNGTGEFFAPRSLYSDGGCIDWRSIVDTRIGLFFQMTPDRIYVLDPSGTPVWISKAVQDTLATYPVIRGAVLCTNAQRVVFAIVDNDASPTGGGLLSYDIERQAWSFDDVGVVLSVVEWQGRLAYVNTANDVLLEDAAIASSGALPTMSVRTGSFRPFSALGYGDIVKIGLLGTYLGDCTVDMYISYDDGKTWSATPMSQTVTAAAFTNHLTGAAIAAGDPITLFYVPNVRAVDRFALRFDVTNGSSNTGGVRLHMLSLEVEVQEGMVRRAARDQR